MTLATRLKERRKELKMTQVTLAELTGVTIRMLIKTSCTVMNNGDPLLPTPARRKKLPG